MGLGLALGAFLKCLVNPTFADEVKGLALMRKRGLKKIEPESKQEAIVKQTVQQESVPDAESLSDYQLGAIQILSELQKEGRLVDFLEENLSDYEDDEIGSSVRSIHEGCKKVMDRVLDKEKLVDQEEESSIRINKDYNVNEIKLSGRVSESFPQKGLLVHPGWKAKKVKLSARSKASSDIICPAEIEID